MDVLTLVNRLSSSIFGGKSDDDFSDRLNYRYTVGLLILFSIILSKSSFFLVLAVEITYFKYSDFY